ncbi:MAG: hypothetical protein HY682_00260 [Chloroflexi bacterium]|nr:hypothetical protein [Chloroflexota bacterium]
MVKPDVIARARSIRAPVCLIAISLVILMALACGSGDSGTVQPPATTASTSVASGSAASTEQEISAVLRPGDTFTIDQLVAAGWKKSKQFDAATLPSAVDVWYGFYDRRDIEVRVYGSHGDAKGPGVDAALEAIGRSPNSNIGGGIITSLGNRTQYHAYVVAGNLVLLCEHSTETCVRLVQQVK